MKPMTTDVIFDLGGVLIDLDTPSMLRACERYGVDPQLFFVPAREDSVATVCQGVASSPLVADYQEGLISTDELIASVLPHCPETTTAENIRETWNACLGDIPTERLDLIRRLRQQGYRTHLLSNTSDMHWRAIVARYFSREGYTPSDLFDQLFLSHEIHLSKPNPAIYRYVIEAIGVPAEQLLFVDDAKTNTDAAMDAGIPSRWLDLSSQTLVGLFESDPL